VTIGSTVDVRGIRGGSGGPYLIQGGTLANPGGLFIIDVGTSGSGRLTIDSNIDASDLIKNGPGTLEFNGTTTGSLRTQGGKVILSGDNLPDDAFLDILPGSEVQMNGRDTVGDLFIDGTLSGSGTLTASTYSLFDGAVINGKLGEGLFFKSDAGTVTINGNLGADVVNVPEGTLILGGFSLDNQAALSASGTGIIDVSWFERVGTYVQSGDGKLVGIRPLTVTYGSTLNGGEVGGDLMGSATLTNDVLVSGSIGSGQVTVTGGTLTITGGLTTADVIIESGAALAGNGATNALRFQTIANSGSLTLAADQGTATYTQEIGGSLAGTGALRVSRSYRLNGGEISGVLSGAGDVSGNVLVSGTVRGTRINLESGQLDLTGTLSSERIEIVDGAILSDRGDLGDASQVSNKGILKVETADVIQYYRQGSTGLLNGREALTVLVGSQLDGGEVAGTLLGDLRVKGNALVSGTVGDGTLEVPGTLTLTGNSTHSLVNINRGLLIDRGDLADSATVENSGTLTVEVDETVDRYIQNNPSIGRSLLNGPGSLTATGGATLNAGDVATSLIGDVTSTGGVRLTGRISGGNLLVTGGILSVSGQVMSPLIDIETGTLALSGGNLEESVILSTRDSGTLRMNGDQRIASYQSDGGILTGDGTLSVTGRSDFSGGSVMAGFLKAESGAFFLDSSVVSGTLFGNSEFDDAASVSFSGRLFGNLTSRGEDVRLAGISEGNLLQIIEGMLTVSGRAIHPSIRIDQPAMLVDQSPNAFADNSVIANHGILSLDGSERIGSYQSSSSGRLQLDVLSPGVLDRLIAGTVNLDPGSGLILETSDLQLGQRADIIDAPITGTFSSIQSLAGTGKDLRYIFNPNNGTIQATPARPTVPQPDRFLNLSANQTQVIGTVFDATHLDPIPAPGQPPSGNFRRLFFTRTGSADPSMQWREIPISQFRVGDVITYDLDPGLGMMPVTPGTQTALMSEAIINYQSAYDFRRDRNGQLVLDAQNKPVAIVTNAGKQIANLLSPEVSQGMADFTSQALLAQQRAILDSPTLLKEGKAEFFAALQMSSSGTDASQSSANYDISVSGFLAGGRYHVNDSFTFGAALGHVDGTLQGPLVNADGEGLMFSLFGECLIDPKSHTRAYSTLGFGSFSYDASRVSYGGLVAADDIGSSALEISLGLESTVIEHDAFRLSGLGELRYLNGSVDSFVEGGSGVRMAVGEMDVDELLFELGVVAEFDLSDRATLSAQLGYQADLRSSGNRINGRYLGGGLPVSVLAPGIGNQALIFALGADIDVTESCSVGIHWRTEFRDSSQNLNLLSLSTGLTF